VPARDRVRASLLVYLDHIGERSTGWAAPFLHAGNDPDPAAEVRRQARGASVGRLRALLQPSVAPRHDYALPGFFGFLDGACLEWVRRGCPEHDRHPLVEAALGALEGALGDWGG
ncbi:MAG TPA: hypothetical protein VHM65_01320, partial [Candidatus Lustribacter sp.]|nr:hypothetical protein [Candidatus Lustribacter sp.]